MVSMEERSMTWVRWCPRMKRARSSAERRSVGGGRREPSSETGPGGGRRSAVGEHDLPQPLAQPADGIALLEQRQYGVADVAVAADERPRCAHSVLAHLRYSSPGLLLLF
jgi:hypothetical protein